VSSHKTALACILCGNEAMESRRGNRFYSMYVHRSFMIVMVKAGCSQSTEIKYILKIKVAQFFTGHNVQGGPEKTAQTLMRYNFSTAGHRVTRFPAKCSETNW